MRETEYFLSMHVQQDLTKGTIKLTQCPYWEHVITWYNLGNISLQNIPIGMILDNGMCPQTDSERKEMNGKPYCSILGSVMWGQTRPDLSFTVSLLSRFQSNPGIDLEGAYAHLWLHQEHP